jgi:hypothetical protein
LRFVSAFVLCFVFSTAVASDFVVSGGKLDDLSFYQQVACAAEPGHPCRQGLLRWQKNEITISIVGIDSRLSHKQRQASEQALANAIHQVNHAGAAIRLRRVSGDNPDIRIFLTADFSVNGHEKVRAIRKQLGRSAAGVARVSFVNSNIEKAVVVIAARKRQRELQSVMLEEVVQSLGLVNDIRNRFYRHRSVFSETDSSTTTLANQDATALRMHYPKR